MSSSRSGRIAALLGASGAAAALAFAKEAAAYCVTSYCPDPDNQGKFVSQELCDGAPLGEGCRLARWREPCVSYSAQKDGSSQLPMADTLGAIQQAFDTWMNIDCGEGRHPSITVEYFGLVECRVNEFSGQTYGNANIYMFRETPWEATHPYVSGQDTIALTTISYWPNADDPTRNLKYGDILDADIDVNGSKDEDGKVRYAFTVGDSDVQTDLLSILTHETGHFLGLQHSMDATSTMTPTYTTGETHLRAPNKDDINALCLLYPPDRKSDMACTGIPRHGYSTECAAVQQAHLGTYGCSAASASGADAGRGAGGGAKGLGLAGAALVVLLARRRRRG